MIEVARASLSPSYAVKGMFLRHYSVYVVLCEYGPKGGSFMRTPLECPDLPEVSAVRQIYLGGSVVVSRDYSNHE